LKESAFRARSLTGKIRKLPDFIIIGAQRCGTTSLHNYLAQHPSIDAPFVKEIHYFDLNYERDINWYRAHFPVDVDRFSKLGGKKQCFTGEATPYYVFHPHAARRISAALPNVKLFLLVRNPTERAYSSYLMRARRGAERLSFEECIEIEEGRIADETEKMLKCESYASHHHRKSSYISRGKYAEQLEVYLRYFSRDQIFVETSEEFFEKPQKTLDKAYEFIGAPHYNLNDIRVHNSMDYSPMGRKTRDYLDHLYKPHNQALADLLGRDLSWGR